MKRIIITLLISLLFASLAMNILLGMCVADINHDIGLINETDSKQTAYMVQNFNDTHMLRTKVQANHNKLVLQERGLQSHKDAILYLMQEGHTHEESR